MLLLFVLLYPTATLTPGDPKAQTPQMPDIQRLSIQR